MKNGYLCIVPLIALLFAGCNSYKNIPYLQGSENITQDEYAAQKAIKFDAQIMPNDLLTITVSTTEPEAAIAFNLTVPTPMNQNNTLTSQPTLQPYLVDNNGQINFPTLGLIHVGGMTKREAEAFIQGKLSAYIKETPIVTVRFMDYKISVLGEVVRPGTYDISNEKVNVFQALAQAGDLTIYGKRDNIKIMREEADGKKRVITINLNDKNLIYSPDYYLQQNDVIYVEPNKARAQSSDVGSMTSIVVSGASILISVVSLVFNIIK